MGASITGSSGHYYLDSWILSSVLHLSTKEFCRRFLNNRNDPGGRQYAQMTQAARSCPANIAEGSARRDTSIETMMKLTDVARATLCELSYDYLSLLLSKEITPWPVDEPDYISVNGIRLPRPNYSESFMHDVGEHILACKKLFDPWTGSDDWITASNALIIVCGRIDRMITKQLERNLKDFSENGGFTENLTQTRLEARRQQAIEENAPACPVCGKPMTIRYVKRGVKQGQPFWGCIDFPKCNGAANKK